MTPQELENMDVKISERSINFSGEIDKIKPFSEIHADVIMRKISKQTGDRWGAVKLSGYWVISCVPAGDDRVWLPVYGHQGERTRLFSRALANASQKAVVQTIPF